mmetsp:Transcript_19491/g.44148  ORF Transcript_19491/g.44148 Transcript_19491/m.44148 type:complete len:375 (+) Transcript_19491:36-1160(+)
MSALSTLTCSDPVFEALGLTDGSAGLGEPRNRPGVSHLPLPGGFPPPPPWSLYHAYAAATAASLAGEAPLPPLDLSADLRLDDREQPGWTQGLGAWPSAAWRQPPAAGDPELPESFDFGAPASPVSGPSRKGRIELSLAERTSAPAIDATSALGTALSQLVLTPPPRSGFRADAPVFVPGFTGPGALDFETPAKVSPDDFIESRSRMLRVRQLLADEERQEVSYTAGKASNDSPLRLSTAKRVQESLSGSGVLNLDGGVQAASCAHVANDPVFAALAGMTQRPTSPAKVPLTPGPQPPRNQASTSSRLAVESTGPGKIAPAALANVADPTMFGRGPVPAGQVKAAIGKGSGKGESGNREEAARGKRGGKKNRRA